MPLTLLMLLPVLPVRAAVRVLLSSRLAVLVLRGLVSSSSSRASSRLAVPVLGLLARRSVCREL